jgi:hypothetical protein
MADVAGALEERERCLISWVSMNKLLQPTAGAPQRVVLRRPVELAEAKRTSGQSAGNDANDPMTDIG